MQQLSLDLLPPFIPTLDNFVVGDNGLLIASVRRLGTLGEQNSSLYVWGISGSGRSHLLSAWATERGLLYLDARHDPLFRSVEIETLEGLALDNVEYLKEEGQRALFTFYNRVRTDFLPLLLSACVPISLLKWSNDLLSRLTWGLCFEIHPLTDQYKRQALQDYAGQRGIVLPEVLLDYLFIHATRELSFLMQVIAELDQRSLSYKHPINLSLLREVLNDMSAKDDLLINTHRGVTEIL